MQCSAPVLCGLMSYSCSGGLGLIKVERDNSRSRSLELSTFTYSLGDHLRAPNPFLFLSPPVSHALTFSLFFKHPRVFLPFVHPLLYSTQCALCVCLFSLSFFFFFHAPNFFLPFKSSLSALTTFF